MFQPPNHQGEAPKFRELNTGTWKGGVACRCFCKCLRRKVQLMWRGENCCVMVLWQVRPCPKQEVALLGAYIQMWSVAMPADFLDGKKCRKG